MESSYHGSALLYRLLQHWPPGGLRIVEGNLFPPQTDRRLTAVTHTTLPVGRSRWLHSRFHDTYAAWLTRRAPARLGRLAQQLGAFAPEAVLTVVHGYSWLTAAAFAEREHLPLHLIIHDDWPRVVPPNLTATTDRGLARVYRQAVSRLCTSPFMAQEYRRRYGVDGEVLYPSRAGGAPAFRGVPARVGQPLARPTIVFAGTINSPGYVDLLRTVADGVQSVGGRLLIFGPLTRQQAVAAGLHGPTVEIGGLLSSEMLMQRLREEADVLLVPMSFAEEDAVNMQMGFPSKLTDYTAVGLPMLVVGPAYCSVVKWAFDNPGVAEVVVNDAPAAIAAAIARLMSDDAHRVQLARTALAVGDRQFAADAARAQFIDALTRCREPDHRGVTA